jgi:serine protease
MPVVEYYNTGLQHYFITAVAAEMAMIEAGGAGPGWQRTGYGFRAYLPENGVAIGALPVCRFYGTPGRGPNSHFYTVNAAECAIVKKDPGWTLEGTAFYLSAPVNGQCEAGEQAVYRVYNNRFAQNDSNHRYTTDPNLYAQMQAQGWLAEGVVFCGPLQ